MYNSEYSFDDLLCRSLSLFRQFRLYDDCMACEESAIKLLGEAEAVIADSHDIVCVAKLGCVIECLAHKYYMHSDTDGMQKNAETLLIKSWKGLKKTDPEAFIISLWLGEFFLLRLKNIESRSHNRSKNLVSKILSFMTDMLRKPEQQQITSELLDETVNWVKEICDMHICEKRVVVLLERIYSMQKAGMGLPEEPTKDTLLRQMWNFYY